MGFIKLLYTCLVIFFERYREYNSRLILFLSFSELFPAFNWDKEIGNQLSIWSGVSIFSPFSSWFLVCSAHCSLCKSGISAIPCCLSSDYSCRPIFVFSTMLSSNSAFDSDCLDV